MAKIYLSPSTQDWNVYNANDGIPGPTNEESQMRAICFPAADLLRAAGHQVKVGGTVSCTANAIDANAWGADWYLAVHSNAGGGRGTEAWFYTGSTRGKALASAVYKRVAAVTAAPDRGLKSSTGYIELNKPKAPSAILEIEFHDYPAGAKEIETHHAAFARAIALGVCDVAGGKVPAAPVPAPAAIKRKVTASALNVRRTASIHAPVVHVLKRGEIVVLTTRVRPDGWVGIRHGSVLGFVAARYLAKV